MTRKLWEYSPLLDKLASLHADSDKFLRRRADFMGAQLNVATAEQAPYVYIGYLSLKKKQRNFERNTTIYLSGHLQEGVSKRLRIWRAQKCRSSPGNNSAGFSGTCRQNNKNFK